MGISGNLNTMSLADILQWLHIGAKTGTLTIEKESIVKKVFFTAGQVVSSFSNDPREYFGQFLINLGMVSEEQLQDAMEEQGRSGTLIGRIFVDEGLVTEDEVRKILTYKAEETIYDLFLWPEGSFEFTDGDGLAGPQVTISLTVDKITFEGIRRVDEWRRIREVFPSGNVVMKLDPAKVPDQLRGDHLSARILALVSRKRTISEIGLETRSSEFQISKTLYDWYSQGFLQIAEIRAEPPRQATQELEVIATEEVDEVAEELKRAQELTENRQFEDALRATARVLQSEPGHTEATNLRNKIGVAYHKYLQAYFGGGTKIPSLNVSLQELMTKRTDFSPEEGFIVSRINGSWNVQAIAKVSPIPEFHALRILKRLEEEGIISVK